MRSAVAGEQQCSKTGVDWQIWPEMARDGRLYSKTSGYGHKRLGTVRNMSERLGASCWALKRVVVPENGSLGVNADG